MVYTTVKIDKTRFILTGKIQEFVFFCNQVDKPPAWFRPILNRKDVERIPVGSTIILYGTYHTSSIYPLIQDAWDKNLIDTQVITPDEVATKYNS
jgi:hypothetical protein